MERFCATMSGSECAKPRSNLVPVDNLDTYDDLPPKVFKEYLLNLNRQTKVHQKEIIT
jgi:hypothetical protein